MLVLKGLLAKVFILIFFVALASSVTSYFFVSTQQESALNESLKKIKQNHRQSAQLFIEEQLKQQIFTSEEIIMMSEISLVNGIDVQTTIETLWPRLQLNFMLSSMAISNGNETYTFGFYPKEYNKSMLNLAFITGIPQKGVVCHKLCEISTSVPTTLNEQSWVLSVMSDISSSILFLSSVLESDIGILANKQAEHTTNMTLSRYVVEYLTGSEQNHDLFRHKLSEKQFEAIESKGLNLKFQDKHYLIWIETLEGYGEDLRLLLISDISNLLIDQNSQNRQLFIVFIIITVGILVCLTMFSILPIAKINQLTRATKLIGEKQYDSARYKLSQRDKPKMQDELYELENEFKQTIDILETYEQELTFSQKRLVKQATIDGITGLFTRNVLIEDLTNMRIDNSVDDVAIFFLDLDGFKPVNDNLGHEAGDIMLKKIGYRLKGVINKSTKVYRIGGDEFVICQSNYKTVENLNNLAQSIVEIFSAPFNIYDTSINMSASIGIAMQNANSIDADELLRYADIAMYQAKEEGKNRFRFFDDSMRAAAKKRFTIKNDFVFSLADKQLFLVFQPIVRASDRETIKLEALCRWQHPDLGFISPELFIDVLEESENMNALFEWIIDTVIDELIYLDSVGLSHIVISVNLSTSQLVNDTAFFVLQEKLTRKKIDPARIELEITETSLITNFARAKVWVEQATEYGFRIAIDDFGAGYSSLSYLTAFPYNTVKLDRSLLNNIDKDSRQQRIVGSLTQMLHGLKVPIVAEGAECEEQFEVLKNLGCDYIQGFLISKPIPHSELVLHFENINHPITKTS